MNDLQKLQARWRKANESLRAYSRELTAQYGDPWRAPAGKERQLEAKRARESAAADAIFAWLDEHSPRGWRSGCPAHWICDELTIEDALTDGTMSVVPPCSYGSYPSDMVRFASALVRA